MKKLGNSLHISIPKPCSVAWDKMEQRENARFCSTCQKEVVDFSKLNNKQLLQYISTNRQIPCGRFHSSQLNKNLLQEEKRYRYWKKVYKTILAVLTFLSLKPANAVAQGRPITITEPTNKKISGDTSTSLVTITGTVRDSEGEPLEGAVISVSEVEMARTDHNGQFRFENKQMEFLLVVHYTGMTRIVRNYHPAMQSTAYNLIMEPPIVCSDHILGVPIINDFIPSIEIDFSPIHPVNNEVRERLSGLANAMRSFPDAKMTLIGYANTPKETKSTREKLNALQHYFVEREGISKDRLILKIKIEKTKNKNIVEIVQHESVME